MTTSEAASILAYEMINDKYSKAKYLGIKCIMETKTGFINATKFCTAAGDGKKRFDNYTANARYKKLFNYMRSAEKKAVLSMEVRTGDNSISGTYVHPDLLLDLASWISPCVFCKVTQLLNEWRKLDVINELRFHKEVGDAIKEGIVFSKQENESIIRDQIAYEENGETEVKTPVGFIDVLTDTKIIEVKQANLWKHALGQVKCYGYYYPDKQKWIYLFNKRDTECEGKNFESDQDLLNICISENIMVKFYN